MFLGDTGKGGKTKSKRYNFDVLVDNEKLTLQKLSSRLGFYSIEYQGKFKEIETVYDTPNNLLTGSGIVIRKRLNKDRCYFSLIRINSLKNSRTSDRKEFLGECDPKDQPKNFPVQIADRINEIFNSVFTVDLVDVINHCEPYVYYEITGNKYKIISGTGYSAEMSFENFNVRNMRTGKRARLRNFSISFPMQPEFEKESRSRSENESPETCAKRRTRQQGKTKKEKRNKRRVIFFFLCSFHILLCEKESREKKTEFFDEIVFWLWKFGIWCDGTNLVKLCYVLWDKRAWALGCDCGNNYCNNIILGWCFRSACRVSF